MQKKPLQAHKAQGSIPGGVAMLSIACDGMAGCGGMQSDLVHAPGDGGCLQQGVALKALHDPKMGQGVAGNGAPCRGWGGACHRGVHGGECLGPLTDHQGQVVFIDQTLLDEVMQQQQGLAVLGDQEAAAGGAIEAMGQLDVGAQQGKLFDQAVAVAAAAVHRHTAGFVENQKIGVLVQDAFFEALGVVCQCDLCPFRISERGQADLIPIGQPAGWLGPLAVEADLTAADGPIETGPGNIFYGGDQEIVEALPLMGMVNHNQSRHCVDWCMDWGARVRGIVGIVW